MRAYQIGFPLPTKAAHGIWRDNYGNKCGSELCDFVMGEDGWRFLKW